MARIDGLSEKMSKLLETGGRKLVYYNEKTVERLHTRLKDRIPKEEKSAIVYEIPCQHCNAKYIGHTNQRLLVRLKQHKRDCARRKWKNQLQHWPK